MSAERPAAGAESPGRERRTGPVRLLIMQSQDYFGADSRIQAELAGALDKGLVEVHVACNAGRPAQPSAALAKFREIDGIALRPTRFGPTRTGATRLGLLRDALVQGPAAAASLFGLLRYCRKHRIEIVHGTEKPRDAWYGYLLARLIGARCIVHVHIKAEMWIRRSVRRAMGRSELLAISDFVAGSLRDLGYAPEHIHTVLNGLDMSDWDPDKHDGGRVRAELGLAENVPLLAIVARLFVWKGHLELLAALAQVRQVHPDVRLLVVGIDDPRGAPGRQNLTDEMREVIATHGMEENVIFTGYRSDVGDIMAACDIYAMPTFEEPFGMVFLEAMALERPVVALDNGGTKEVVVDGETGLLSPVGDTAALADNIVRLIEDPELRATMGRAGRRRAVEEFNAGSMARPVERLYRSLTGRS